MTIDKFGGAGPLLCSLWRYAAAMIALPLSIASLQAMPPMRDAPVSEEELRADIRILAGDEFLGREPASEGEVRTVAHIVGQWAAAGLQPLDGSKTPWLQPVTLAETIPLKAEIRLHHQGRSLNLRPEDIILAGRDESHEWRNVPLVFAGYGVKEDGSPSSDVRGKAAIILMSDPPFGDGDASMADRMRILAEAGAEAVLVAVDRPVAWGYLQASLKRPIISLAKDSAFPALRGYIALPALDRLMDRSGHSGKAMRDQAQSPQFAGLELPFQMDGTASNQLRHITSHNVVAQLAGRNPDGKSIIIMGHWDHLGRCGDDSGAGAADHICNGAVDNASGIAAMNAIAKRLTQGPRLDRDVIFLATTAEEKGLLGAKYFVKNSPVALEAITVALNLDTIAIAPRGAPVAIIGKASSAYLQAIQTVASSQNRELDFDGEADEFLNRQDGAAFAAQGVSAFMLGGSFSDMDLLNHFLSGSYHQPSDDQVESIELGGAADDSDLHIALIRLFADRERWDGSQMLHRPLPPSRPAGL